jgi:hypothetical protein
VANHAELPLQTRLFEILSGDATLAELIGADRVFDFVPENEPYPYITIGDMESRDWGSHTHDGFEFDAHIHTWTKASGRKQALEIMARVYQLLHNLDISITDFPTITCREADRRIPLDPDGRTYHGIQRFRIVLGGN